MRYSAQIQRAAHLERVWELGKNIDIGRFSERCYVIVSSNFVPWNHFTDGPPFLHGEKTMNEDNDWDDLDDEDE